MTPNPSRVHTSRRHYRHRSRPAYAGPGAAPSSLKVDARSGLAVPPLYLLTCPFPSTLDLIRRRSPRSARDRMQPLARFVFFYTNHLWYKAHRALHQHSRASKGRHVYAQQSAVRAATRPRYTGWMGRRLNGGEKVGEARSHRASLAAARRGRRRASGTRSYS